MSQNYKITDFFSIKKRNHECELPPAKRLKLRQSRNFSRGHVPEAFLHEVQRMSKESAPPAQEKVKSTEAPTLTLPYKYRLLEEMFRCADTIVSITYNRNELCTFSKLKSGVQNMLRKNFELHHLGQLVKVYPESYVIRQEKMARTRVYCMTIEPVINVNQNNIVQDGRPVLCSNEVVRRRGVFRARLFSMVKDHHQRFLDTVGPWHPKFLDNVPEPESAELPQPPETPKVEQALIDKTVTTVKSSASLLERIRAKEALNKQAAMLRNNTSANEISMLGRLPTMIKIIRSYFITEKRGSLSEDSVISKLCDSYDISISQSSVESHINYMLTILPEWISRVSTRLSGSSRNYIKISRQTELSQLNKQISLILKQKQYTTPK